jgi:hypothetical protein
MPQSDYNFFYLKHAPVTSRFSLATCWPLKCQTLCQVDKKAWHRLIIFMDAAEKEKKDKKVFFSFSFESQFFIPVEV